ncbi:hypothetical protein G9A89_002368 [Geosiphon pyriformis]|nr:hypothetical protein G9A89_002368 [Geosiphon pyriformis]
MAKTQFIRKIFSKIIGFGGATIPSKFEEIIRSTFTSEESMKKAVSLARENGIIVNTDLKKQEVHSDWAVVIKKIPIDMPKEMIIAAVSEYGQIVSIKVQLIGLWQKAVVEFAESSQADLLASKWSFLIEKNSVHVAKTVGDHETWAFRDQFRVLFFTLPVGMTAHDLGTLLEGAGKKTCVINHLLKTGNRTRCAVVCFESNKAMELAFCMEPIFGGMKLLWARLDLVCCERCGKFGHSALECDAGLAKLYAKKKVSISCSVAFGGKSWAQVVSIALAFHGFYDGSGSGSLLFGASSSGGTLPPLSMVDSPLGTCLAHLEHFVELLSDQISNILFCLDNLSLVPSAPPSSVIPLVGTSHPSISDSLMVADSDLGFNMVLELKLVALNASIGSILAKLEQMCAGLGPLRILFVGIRVFTSGLNSGHMSSRVIIIINNFLAWHVCKVLDILGRFFSVKLFFKNKLSVSVLGLYAGSFLTVHFSQANNIIFLIVKTVNESFFIILSGDFNEDGSRKSASFRKCFDLGLVNSLSGSLFGKEATWANSHEVAKIIDYVFVSSSLVNAILDHNVSGIEEYFDTDHKAVSVSVGLGGLLNAQLNLLSKQVNKDHWKYNFFKEDMLVNAVMFHDEFYAAKMSLNLDTMWSHFYQVVCLSAENVFKKKWFKGFDSVYNKVSSRFHKLELLVLKIVKAFHLVFHEKFASLLDTWKGIDPANTFVVDSLFLSGSHFDTICSALAKIRKSYHSSKLSESNCAKESQIKSVIDKRMESFELNKSHTVCSILKRPFRKVVLDHLVIGDELVLDPAPVKSKTRKHRVVLDVNDEWSHQYHPLGYVFDEAFSGVMGLIDFNKLFGVVSNLPDGKAAGLSGISNELWKHCDISVLNMLLVLLNSCLSEESVPGPWREAWESVFTNTCPIALIETAHKIFSKILSDRISLACSTYNVFYGNNFSVLRGTMTQSPIFAVGLVDMRKAYDLVGWEHLEKFMTDFGLTDCYQIYDSLDQEEVFSILLWCIFYDPLLCKVKCQESMCEYRLISHFVFKSGHVESQAGLSFFFATGAFVDDTIWVGSSQSATQHILDINDISINNDKTVAIFINCRVENFALFISGSPISIAKKGEFHQYLGIFLSIEGLSKPSLTRVYLDICFFTNLVLKKAISNKQFLYLVSVVPQTIFSYRTQFSFIPIGICNKWDAMIHKGLKLKSGLLLDFPSDLIYPFFYDLKSLLQIQSENKVASLINFANFGGIVGCLFSYRSHDLQVLCWRSIHSLSSPVCICVSVSNNFLVGVVRVLYNCKLSLDGSFANFFRVNSGTPMSTVLDESVFSRCLTSLQQYGVVFVDQLCDCHGTKLDARGPVPEWFRLSAVFLADEDSASACIPVLANIGLLDILGSSGFVSICDHFSQVNTRVLSVYTDGLLRNLGTIGCKVGAVAFFEDIGMGLGVGVSGLMSSTMAELQAIALALECILVFSNVHLFLDSQSALDACKLELGMVASDFQNQCWIKCWHIANVISSKVLNVTWRKVKGYSGVLENKHADVIADADFVSDWFLPPHLDEYFLMTDGNIVSGNLRHFVHDTFHAMCRAYWEVGSGSKFLPDNLRADVDWSRLSLVWHPDLHMVTSFTSRISANGHSYFIKALHY